MSNSNDTSWVRTSDFQFVAQHSNHCAPLYISMCTSVFSSLAEALRLADPPSKESDQMPTSDHPLRAVCSHQEDTQADQR